MSRNQPFERWTHRRSDWHPTARCRYELAYVTSESPAVYERWLIEWAMDVIGVDDVLDVSVARAEECVLSIRIDVRPASGVTALDERYQALLSELSERADGLWIQRHAADLDATVDR